MQENGGGMPLPDFDFLKEFGISEKDMEALKPRLGQIVGELIQGAHQFAQEEKQIIAIRNNATKEIGGLLAQNINASRNFFLTLATLSLTIVGVIISALASGHNIFKGTFTLYSGLGLLIVCVVVSVLYLLNRLATENNNLTKYLDLERSIGEEMHELMGSYYKEKKTFEDYFPARKDLIEKNKKLEKEFAEKARRQSKIIFYTPFVICFSFLIGLALIGLSLWF